MTNQGTAVMDRVPPQVTDSSVKELIDEIGLTFWALPYSFKQKWIQLPVCQAVTEAASLK